MANYFHALQMSWVRGKSEGLLAEELKHQTQWRFPDITAMFFLIRF